MKEVCLTSDVTHLVADAFISVGALASQLGLLLAELGQGLLIDIGLLVQVDRKLFNVIDNESIRCYLDLVSLDPQLAQLSFHVEQLIRHSLIGLCLILNDLRALMLTFSQRILQLLGLLGRLDTHLLQSIIETFQEA